MDLAYALALNVLAFGIGFSAVRLPRAIRVRNGV